METAERTLPGVGDLSAPPPLGSLRTLQWWLFLIAVWAPVLAFIGLPVVLVFVSAARSLWLWVPWCLVALLVARWVLTNLRVGRRAGRAKPLAASAGRPQKSVVVIGAGPVGLAAVKELLAVGVDVTCLERADALGGVFRFDPEREGGVWPTTRLTSSPWVTAFSDFPPSTPDSAHWLHDEYLDYLERYAAHFALLPHVRFGHEVVEVLRDGERWRVRARRHETGETIECVCDHVAISSGLNLEPRSPEIPGSQTFHGQVRHLATYKGPATFAGARVVVVGLGETAVDVAHELASVAASVSLSVRRGKFIIPRVNPQNGVANDYDTNRLRYSTPTAVRNVYMLLKRWTCAGSPNMDPRARLRLSLLRASGAGPMSQPATKSDEFLDDVLEGRVTIQKPIARLEGRTVIYADGHTEEADFVLMGTGYRPRFPFFSWGDVSPVHPGEMFLNAFVPELGDGVAFLGCARPTIGAIPPTGEMQARYFAELVLGRATLPSEEEMREAIARATIRNRRTLPMVEQPNALVEWIPYLDQVAERIGCRPSPMALLRRPRLAWKLMSGPMTGAMYRLEGPGAAPDVAERTIRMLPRKHELFELLTHAVLHFYVSVIGLVTGDPRLDTSSTFV